MTGQTKNNNDILINQSSGKNKSIPWNKDKKGVMPEPWNKGLKGFYNPKTHEYLSYGENASYETKHKWMAYHYGSPNFCEACGKENEIKYEWANISGEYKRDREDWLRLCKKCHHEFDIAVLGQNRKINKNNSSGYKGVCWSTIMNKWRAYIVKNYKQIQLGYFATAKEAAIAYNRAAIKIYGKNAWQNKII